MYKMTDKPQERNSSRKYNVGSTFEYILMSSTTSTGYKKNHVITTNVEKSFAKCEIY